MISAVLLSKNVTEKILKLMEQQKYQLITLNTKSTIFVFRYPDPVYPLKCCREIGVYESKISTICTKNYEYETGGFPGTGQQNPSDKDA